MESIDGKDKHDSFNSRKEEKQPLTTQVSAKNSPSSQKQKFQHEKEATSPEQGKRQTTSHKTLQPGLQNSKDSAGFHGKCISDIQKNDGISEKGGSQTKMSEIIFDTLYGIPSLCIAINGVKSHISDENSSICNKFKTNNLILSQINETLMCFGKVFREIETSNNDNSFGNEFNEQSSILNELTDKHSRFNIYDIAETRIKQAINIIKEDNMKGLDDIANSFTEVKTYTIALKKCFYTSQQELSKLTMKWNQVTSDNTRQTELWKKLTNKEYMYKIEVMNLIQSFQNELRNSQRCSNSKISDIE
ncbi:hypothetical protein O181_002044 [Austropuccinia psidii MF-1]|uniref:Uncharacterized protein n=1 Tax=Austropuccinia psidii MF-1 TaxID=1389203 RepID=A0A9Q3BBL3_9BASI|nr:hypothetical protein [Austropuccinia psidii MF-1]